MNTLCCLGPKKKNEIVEDPNHWHTLNGVDYWPGAFADETYNAHMAKRGYAAIRRNSHKEGKLLPINEVKMMSPSRGNVLT